MINPSNFIQPECGCSFYTSGDYLNPIYCASHGASAEELRALGNAIAQAAVKAGIIDGTMPLTGLQLLMLCDDLANAALVSTQAATDEE